MAESLTAGRVDEVAELFRRNGAPAPVVLWRPTLIDLQHPVLRSFMRGCGGEAGPVSEAFLESEDFAALSDWTMLLEKAEDGSGLVYRHYGAGIAESYGRDLTGTSPRDLGGHIALFFEAIYSAAMRRREIVKTVHEPPRQVFVMSWMRLIVPLVGRDGTIERIAVANVPDNPLRAGLDVLPDPVLVVSAQGVVCVANRAASLQFGRKRTLSPGERLADWTGLDIPLPESPEALILNGPPKMREIRVAYKGRIVDCGVSYGATYYRDQAYFVIALRLKGGTNA